MDPAHPAFAGLIERVIRGRRERNLVMLEKLAGLGLPLTYEEVRRHAVGRVVARPHFARALLERGHVDDLREAFRLYLEDGGPAYVHAPVPTPAVAIEATVEAGGVAVLAHPRSLQLGTRCAYEKPPGGPDAAGLSGLEVDHPSQDPTQRAMFGDLARRVRSRGHRRQRLPRGGQAGHRTGNRATARSTCATRPGTQARGRRPRPDGKAHPSSEPACRRWSSRRCPGAPSRSRRRPRARRLPGFLLRPLLRRLRAGAIRADLGEVGPAADRVPSFLEFFTRPLRKCGLRPRTRIRGRRRLRRGRPASASGRGRGGACSSRPRGVTYGVAACWAMRRTARRFEGGTYARRSTSRRATTTASTGPSTARSRRCVTSRATSGRSTQRAVPACERALRAQRARGGRRGDDGGGAFAFVRRRRAQRRLHPARVPRAAHEPRAARRGSGRGRVEAAGIRGDELGRFELGSTVVLLLSRDAGALDALGSGDASAGGAADRAAWRAARSGRSRRAPGWHGDLRIRRRVPPSPTVGGEAVAAVGQSAHDEDPLRVRRDWHVVPGRGTCPGASSRSRTTPGPAGWSAPASRTSPPITPPATESSTSTSGAGSPPAPRRRDAQTGRYAPPQTVTV